MYLVGYVESMKEKIDSFKKEFQQSDCLLKELNNNFISEDLNDIDGIILNGSDNSDIHSIYRNFLSIKKRNDIFIWIINDSYSSKLGYLYLKLGVDAVFKKNYNMEEIILHIANALNRTRKGSYNRNFYKRHIKNERPLFILCNKNRSCILRHEMYESEIFLTRTEFKVLDYLYKNRGSTCKWENICQYVWGSTNINLSKTDMKLKLNNSISLIRKKIKEYQPDFSMIRTIRNIGYILESK